MLFSSTLFLFLFLPLVLGGHLLLPQRQRNAWLLLASLLFYAWGEPFVVVVMLASVVANWLLGLWVGRDPKGTWPLVSCLLFNLGMLVVFKYADWLASSASDVLAAIGLHRGMLPRLADLVPSTWAVHEVLFTPQGTTRLPIGISFFTFQAMSYVIDVRRGEVPPQRNPFDLALYIALFPQLIAGPIVRYRDVADQIAARSVGRAGLAHGIRRFTIGLGKKMLIANTVAEIADAMFAIPTAELTPACAWLGIVCYTLQIYFDFSGYSDMAIGLGHMFGFRFLENFDHPYVARSITEFWRRWHISLSTWFRDYLYIPLGGNRAGRTRTMLNLTFVFVLCGLWHGASYCFLVWGLYHGAFLVLERSSLRRRLERLPRTLQHGWLLLVVMIGWVFFRADTLPQAAAFLSAMAGLQSGNPAHHPLALYLESPLLLALAAGAIGSTPWLRLAIASVHDRARRAGETPLVVTARAIGLCAIAALFSLSCLLMAAGTYNPFIYFRF